MTSSNRTQLTIVRETTAGTTPNTPRMRTMRITGESLAFEPTFLESDELRADRQNADPAKNIQSSAGGINFELTYPLDNTPISEIIRSAMFNPWVSTPTFFNDGTPDSVVTDAGTVANTYAVVSGGAAVIAASLVQASGFTNSANNQVFKVASSTGTTVVGTALGLVAEAVPPATAKLKVVGFQGASADITATSTGLASTVLDFTLFGLGVGRWIKVGGTVTGTRFAASANNDWARITAVAAHAIALDNLPSGWGVDAGTGKTINVYFGDYIKNGVTPSTVSIERGFLGQTVPTYIVNTGMEVDSLTLTAASKANIKLVAALMGMGGSESTTTLSASPDSVTSGLVISANANVGRVGLNGSQLVSPNWAKSVTFVIANNLRQIDAVDSTVPVAVREGDCDVSGKMTTYFGSDTELAAFYAGTTRPINCRFTKTNQAVIYQVPRATYTSGGNPGASGKNVDVMADFGYKASIDPVTGAQLIIDRLEYFET